MHPCVCSVARMHRLFATPSAAACLALLCMEFSSQGCWSGVPFPSSGDLPDPEIKPVSPGSPALAGGFFTAEPPGKPFITKQLSLIGELNCIPSPLCHGFPNEVTVKGEE